MARLTWLQLSDLHFGFETYTTQVAFDEFIKYLKKAIANREPKPTFLFLTGDYVFAPNGSEKNRNSAISYINKILEITEIKKQNLFMVPGNHDVKRDDVVRTMVLDNLYETYRTTDGRIDPSIVGSAFTGLAAYNCFRKDLYGVDCPCKADSIHECDSLPEVNIVRMNTAFAYYKKRSDNRLIFSHLALYNTLASIKNEKPIILLGHHPLDLALESADIENLIRNDKRVKLYLCGHNHKFGIHTILKEGQARIMCFNNPTFMDQEQKTHDPCQIGFTIGEMDTETGTGLIEAHIYDSAFNFWDKYYHYGGTINNEENRKKGIFVFNANS